MKYNKERNKKIIGWVLLISWMILIFYMSGKSGEESSSQSNLVYNIIKYIGINLDVRFAEVSIIMIRKGAHFLEYMILYILSYNLIKRYIKCKSVYLYPIIIVFLYACTDEFHQLFIQGRAGKFIDVCIDTVGGTFGFIIIYVKNIVLKFIKLRD
ncbi:MAG: VanZ family protein [Clostridium perfringens]|nr:VanZ family protein [Clostridium perfringens]